MSKPLIYRPSDLPRVVGLSTRHCRRLASENMFPRPIKLGRRAVGYRAEDIEQWLADRAATSADN